MDKYFSPTIEELLTEVINNGDVYGFVYNTDTLLQIKFDLPIENSLKYFIENGNKNNEIYSLNLDIYKLKCLDRDDIESMGFIEVIHSYGSLYKKGNFTIEYAYDNVRIVIREIKEQNTTQLFQGIIKNKSELKFILKTLGI